MTRKLFVLTGAVIVAILRAIGRALYQPDDGERVSTWSVRKRDARIFYLLLSGLWLVAAAALAWSQYVAAPPRVLEWATPPPHIGDGSLYIVIQRFGGVAMPLMAVALILTPVITGAGRFLMTLAQFINEKILDPIIEAKVVAPRLAPREDRLREELTASVTAEVTEAVTASVTAEVTATVIAEVTASVTAEVTAVVTAEVDERWAGWLARRDAALAEGRDFNEPRPDAGNHSVG